MKEQRTLRRFALTLVVALLVFGAALGCSLSDLLPTTGAEPEIVFWASEEVVPRGGCAMLHWEVSGAEEYPVFLDGREVPPSGEEEVCLDEPKSFELVVAAPGGSIRESVMIEVEGQSQEPPPEEVPPEEPPEGGPEQIMLVVDPDAIPQGGCAMLHWEVIPPEWPVFIDGQDVPPIGEREECPGATTTYELNVDAPGGPHVRTVTLHVEGSTGPEPSPMPAATATTPPAQAATATTSSPAQPTATTQPAATGADVWPSDLYPDGQPQGKIWVRIVNNGPDTVTNKKVRISGKVTQSTKTTPPKASGSNIPAVEYTISLAPGQQQNISLGWQIDLDQYNYEYTVTVEAVGFTDPNTGNNTFTESFQSAGQQVLTTDLKMSDLYADKLLNGTVYGRITNRGPGTITNVVVSFSCQWSKTAYGATIGLLEQMGPRNMTITGPLPPGQDTPFNTYITVDLTQYWYDMTCTVNVPFSDPDTSNNTYNEKLAKP